MVTVIKGVPRFNGLSSLDHLLDKFVLPLLSHFSHRLTYIWFSMLPFFLSRCSCTYEDRNQIQITKHAAQMATTMTVHVRANRWNKPRYQLLYIFLYNYSNRLMWTEKLWKVDYEQRLWIGCVSNPFPWVLLYALFQLMQTAS